MADRKVETLTHREKQALRHYAAKFGHTKKADLQRHLNDVSNPDRFGELCDNYERDKAEQRIYARKREYLAEVQEKISRSRC